MPIGRNEPCPCGSGKKYKSCCIGKRSGISKGLIALIVAIVCIAAIGLLPSVVGDKAEKTAGPLPAAQPSAPVPRPPGPAPVGKVWSAEHGHWHDASPVQVGQPPVAQPAAAQTQAPTPQPPGPVPAGKVWSTEHGHWHDITPPPAK